jgi:hypothetical protein
MFIAKKGLKIPKDSPTTDDDDGRSRVGYFYIFISDYKNASFLPFKFGKISYNLYRCKYFTFLSFIDIVLVDNENLYRTCV